MILVGLKTSNPLFPWFRQTPNDDVVWGRYKFTTNCGKCHFLVVYDDVIDEFKTNVPKNRRILVIGEPRGIKQYSQKFIDQFGLVLCPYDLPEFKVNCRIGQVGLPWFYGIDFSDGLIRSNLNFKELVNLPINIQRKNKISVICSTKSKLPRHRERLQFVAALKERLGDDLVVYGRGFMPITDKALVINAYKYHLVLENSDCGFNWTEKLADAYLGWAFPIFAGPITTKQDFPEGSFIHVDLNDKELDLELFKTILHSDLYEKSIPILRAARERILFQHNFFPLLIRHFENLELKDGFSLDAHELHMMFPSKSKTKRIFKKLRRFFRPK